MRSVHVTVMPAVTAHQGVLLWEKLGDALQLGSRMLRLADALAMDWEHSCRLDVTGKSAHTLAESGPATAQKARVHACGIVALHSHVRLDFIPLSGQF